MAWAPDYVTATELAEYVRIADDLDDAQLELAVTAASRAIDDATNRQFGQEDAPTPRYYTLRWHPNRRRWVADVDDVQDTTVLAVRFDADETGTYATDVTAWRLTPANAPADGMPYTRLEVLDSPTTPLSTVPDGLEVTARWGWSAVPTAVRQACLLQASRLLARRESPFGIAGSPENDSELRLLARVDPDVEVLLRPYIRWRVRTG